VAKLVPPPVGGRPVPAPIAPPPPRGPQPAVNIAPIITGINPPDAKPNVWVEIDGSDFFFNNGDSVRVLFNGAPTSIKDVSQTVLMAIVPDFAPGTAVVIVEHTYADGTPVASNPFGFKIDSRLAINGFSPTSGYPGDHVTITGMGFVHVTDVKFNGMTASFTIANDNAIDAVVPPNATSGQISATDNGGTMYSTGSYMVKPPPPTFDPADEFDPKMGIVGTKVTLHGKHFATVKTVTFNGVLAPNPVVGAEKKIEVLVPSGATTGRIHVESPVNGGATTANDFIVILQPVLQSANPSSAPPNTVITLNGKHLGEVTAADFNGTTAKFKDKTEKKMKVTVPNVAAGPYTITVRNDAGTAKIGFTVTA
jgi:large repetitive protein